MSRSRLKIFARFLVLALLITLVIGAAWKISDVQNSPANDTVAGLELRIRKLEERKFLVVEVKHIDVGLEGHAEGNAIAVPAKASVMSFAPYPTKVKDAWVEPLVPVERFVEVFYAKIDPNNAKAVLVEIKPKEGMPTFPFKLHVLREGE